MSKATTTKTAKGRVTAPKKRSNLSINTKKMNIERKSGFDFLMALLLVSLLLNLFVVCIWVVLRITNIYDAQLAELFLAR